MRNVRVMNIPVGVLAAWILVLGYMLWAFEAVVTTPSSKQGSCSAPVVEKIEKAVKPCANNS